MSHPEVLWAQRSDKVYLTIALPDAKDVSVKCEPQGLFSFSAKGVQGKSFDFSLELYGNIAPEGCKSKAGLRNILCSIQKEQKGWWKRLLKTEEKPAPYIKVDWNKWCDEDDEESTSSDLASDDDVPFAGEDDGSSDDEGMLCEFHILFFSFKLLYSIGFWIDISCFPCHSPQAHMVAVLFLKYVPINTI